MDKTFDLGNESFNISKFKSFVLVADIGGENTYVAIMGVLSKKEFKIILKQHLKTTQIKKISDDINQILEEAHKLFKIEISTAVIAGAGAISRHREKIKLTNHDLEISIEDLKKETLLSSFILLNNFEAEGFGIDFVNKSKITKISHADIKSTIKTSAILGAGHGLGASIMYYDSKKELKVAIPSEAGHMSLPVEISFDLEFLKYVKDNYFEGDRVPISSEFAVSGKGISILYEFLTTKKLYGEPMLKLSKLNEEDKIKKIFESKEDIYCKRAIELFVSYYARVARNFALATQPYSGLFLTGRVAQASKITLNEYFLKEFLNCPINKSRLEKIPVFLIKDSEITLFGGCNVAINFSDEFLY